MLSLTMRWFSWKVLAFPLALSLTAISQSSNVAQCIPQYDWSITSTGQTPCLLAAFLESACGDPTSVDAIPVGTEYQGPTSSEQNPCTCSSVTYILVSACAGCQDRQFVNWTTWCGHCTNLFKEIFAEPLPASIQIPPWAFMNVTVEGIFNPSLAQAIAENITSASSSIVPSSTFETSSVLPTSTSTSASDSTSSPQASTSRKLGPIVGGVIGGVAVGTIAAIVLWIFCRKRRTTSQEAEHSENIAAVVSPFVTSPTPSSGFEIGSPSSSPQALLFDHQRIYNGVGASKFQSSGNRNRARYLSTIGTESEKNEPPPQYDD